MLWRLLAAAIFCSCLPAALLHAEDRKPEVTKVTPEELIKQPEQFHGKVVEVEGVVRSAPVEVEFMGVTRHELAIDRFIYAASYVQTPAVAEGDRVRIVAKFTYNKHSFCPHYLIAETPSGTVEKVTEKKDEPLKVTMEDLYKAPEKYNGKLIQIETVLDSDPRESEYMGVTRTGLIIETALYVTSFVKVPAVKGDRVQFTGKYMYKDASFVNHRLIVEPAIGAVKKLPEKQKP